MFMCGKGVWVGVAGPNTAVNHSLSDYSGYIIFNKKKKKRKNNNNNLQEKIKELVCKFVTLKD